MNKARYIIATEGILNVAGIYIEPGALQGPLNGDTIPVYNQDRTKVVGKAGDLKRNTNGEISMEIEWEDEAPFAGTKAHFSVAETRDDDHYIALYRAQLSEITLIDGDIYEAKIRDREI